MDRGGQRREENQTGEEIKKRTLGYREEREKGGKGKRDETHTVV